MLLKKHLSYVYLIQISKVSAYVNFKMTEDQKQGSINVAGLSIATSSFFDLDNTTSWVSGTDVKVKNINH